jgi:hypothetical protein
VRIHRREGLAASVPSPARSNPPILGESTGDFGRRGPRGVGHRRAVGASAERWRVCHAHQPPAPIYPAAAAACRCAVPRAMAMRLVTLVQMGGTCLCAGPHRLRGVSTGALSSAHRYSLTVVARCVLHVARCVLHVARCVLHIARCVLHVARCVLHVARCTLRAARCTLRAARCVLRTLHVACCTLHGCMLHRPRYVG